MFDDLELGDMIWMPTFNNDGSLRKGAPEFGVVDHVSRSGKSQTVKRFNPKTGRYSGPSLSVEHTVGQWRPNRTVMLIAKFHDSAGRERFDKMRMGELPPPQTFQPFFSSPPPHEFPSDPRHFTRQTIATIISPRTGQSVTVTTFEHSTRYAEQFLRNVYKVESGHFAPPFKVMLTYYGEKTPLIEGSGDGDVVYVAESLDGHSGADGQSRQMTVIRSADAS
jgi:hypothetical protein